jgi:hypothetical protein
MREAVLVKNFSTTPFPSPTASKIWEPRKLRRVEIPIRLKVLRSPFFTEVTYLSTASPGSSGASSDSLSASSRIVERAVLGQIALAPYPRRSAKWMTSRGSPLSTTIDACVRRPLRIR